MCAPTCCAAFVLRKVNLFGDNRRDWLAVRRSPHFLTQPELFFQSAAWAQQWGAVGHIKLQDSKLHQSIGLELKALCQRAGRIECFSGALLTKYILLTALSVKNGDRATAEAYKSRRPLWDKKLFFFLCLSLRDPTKLMMLPSVGAFYFCTGFWCSQWAAAPNGSIFLCLAFLISSREGGKIKMIWTGLSSFLSVLKGNCGTMRLDQKGKGLRRPW